MSAGVIHYATYFDRHYLSRGLALYRSLTRHSPPFVLWVLCLDHDTYSTLSRMRLTGLVPIPLVDLEQHDRALLNVKSERHPVEYYWTCTAPLLLYILERDSRIDMLTYLDADLYFFDDPTPIYQELQDSSTLLIEHRWSASVNQFYRAHGNFNVGLLIFRPTPDGLACLRWWRERCIDWCFDRVEPDRFGDQKYLDEWPRRFGGVAVLQHKGAALGPWNLSTYPLHRKRGRVYVDDDPLVFYHFNRLRRINRWVYDPTLWRFGHKMSPLVKHHIYVPYIRELRSVTKLIRAADGKTPAVDSLRPDERLVSRLRQAVQHPGCLVVSDRFVL